MLLITGGNFSSVMASAASGSSSPTVRALSPVCREVLEKISPSIMRDIAFFLAFMAALPSTTIPILEMRLFVDLGPCLCDDWRKFIVRIVLLQTLLLHLPYGADRCFSLSLSLSLQ